MYTPEPNRYSMLLIGESWDNALPPQRALYIFLNKVRNGAAIEFLSWHPDWHRNIDAFILLADTISACRQAHPTSPVP